MSNACIGKRGKVGVGISGTGSFFLSNRLANVWLIIEKAIKSDFKTGDLKISVGLKCFVSTVLCVENVLSL